MTSEAENGVYAAGAIAFDSSQIPGYQQGQVLRLSSSTVRMSNENSFSPHIEDEENKIATFVIYAHLLVEHLFQRKLIDSAHTQNLLVLGEGKVKWTDFPDHI